MIVIHIGLAKAGSSRLQTVLSRLERELAEYEIYYPQIGRAGVAHHPLARPLAEGSGSAPELWEELRDFASPHRTVVISSESFETLDPQQIRDEVSGHDVRVVAYMRPATSRIPSFYSQNTKFGFNLEDFDSFFDKMAPDKRDRWLPSALARRWAAAFGGENVRIRALDPDVLTGGSMETDFLEFVGAPGTLSAGIAADGGENSSPPWKTLESLRELHGIAFAGRRPRDIRNDPDAWAFARLTLREAQDAAKQLGWKDRGRYLSGAQQVMLVDIHNREVELLDGAGVDARIPPIEVETSQTRDFLPTALAIPVGERREFIHLVAPRLLRELASKASV